MITPMDGIWEEDSGGRTQGKKREENFMRMVWKKTKAGKQTFSGRPF